MVCASFQLDKAEINYKEEDKTVGMIIYDLWLVAAGIMKAYVSVLHFERVIISLNVCILGVLEALVTRH